MRVSNVVLAYPPGLEFIAAFFGALYAGCVAVPAYPPRARTLDRFHALTGDAGAPVVLSTAATVASMQTIERPDRIGALDRDRRRSPTRTPTAGPSTIRTPIRWR